jgi:nicotinamide mononucleotide transporter
MFTTPTKNIFVSLLIASLLTGFSYMFGVYFKFIKELNWLEIFAVWTSYSCTYLCVVQSRFNYIVGVVSVIALAALFYQQSLFGSMALQFYLIPWLIYGWFRWGSDLNTKPVENIGGDWVTYLAAIAIPIVLGTTILISNHFDGSFVILDSIIFALSVSAQFLLDNKKLENWIIWIIVDIISVWEYWEQGLYVVAIQMGLFILNAVWGYYEWNKTRNTDVDKFFYTAYKNNII